jgi:hypothetical protein
LATAKFILALLPASQLEPNRVVSGNLASPFIPLIADPEALRLVGLAIMGVWTERLMELRVETHGGRSERPLLLLLSLV